MLRPTWRVPPGAMVATAVTISAVRCGALTGPGPPSPRMGICALAVRGAMRLTKRAAARVIVRRFIWIDCKVCQWLDVLTRGTFQMWLALTVVAVFDHDASVHDD